MKTSEAGFTKGPWEATEARIYGNSGLVAKVGFRLDADEQAANVSLIAASPDLYDAADNALNALIGCCVPAGGVDDRKTILEAQAMLRAALAKAQGHKEA